MEPTKGSFAHLKAITPPEKFAVKVRKTILGAGIALLSVVAAVKWGAPWWAGMGGCLLAATIWSGELVLGSVKSLGGALVDLFRRAKGTNGQ